MLGQLSSSASATDNRVGSAAAPELEPATSDNVPMSGLGAFEQNEREVFGAKFQLRLRGGGRERQCPFLAHFPRLSLY